MAYKGKQKEHRETNKGLVNSDKKDSFLINFNSIFVIIIRDWCNYQYPND